MLCGQPRVRSDSRSRAGRRGVLGLCGALGVLVTLVVCPVAAQSPPQPEAGQEAPSEVLSQVEDLTPDGATGFSPLVLLATVIFGVGAGLLQLARRFYRFIGLGIFSNPFSWIFLTVIAGTSALSYLGIAQAADAVAPESQSAAAPLFHSLAALGGATVGNAVSLVRRFLPGLGASSAGAAGISGLEGIPAQDTLFRLIRDAIAEGLHREIVKLARQYELEQIRATAFQLIEGHVTLGLAEQEEAEATKASIAAASSVGDEFDQKYLILQRLMRVCSFKQMRARLELGPVPVLPQNMAAGARPAHSGEGRA